jgi:hypothetical protein
MCCVMQVYKGVVPPGEFSSMVDELVGGPCIAVEVSRHVSILQSCQQCACSNRNHSCVKCLEGRRLQRRVAI